MIYSDTTLEGGPLCDLKKKYSALWLSPPGPGICFFQPIVRTALPQAPKPHCLLIRAACSELDIYPTTVIGLALPAALLLGWVCAVLERPQPSRRLPRHPSISSSRVSELL